MRRRPAETLAARRLLPPPLMARSPISRTPLSKQAGLLRTSLLLSLGLPALACGGSTVLPGSSGGGTAGTRELGPGGSGPTETFAGFTSDGGHQSFGGSSSTAGSAGRGGTGPDVAGTGPYDVAGTGGTNAAGSNGVEACPNPTYNPVTKLTECSNGNRHRPLAVACTYTSGGAGGGGAPGHAGASGGGGVPSTCSTDAECAALPRGYCNRVGNSVPVCKSGCVTDGDCESGVCACDGLYPGRCVDAGCVTDAQCAAHSLCVTVDEVCGDFSFQCTSPEDNCTDNSDCPGGCVMRNGHRECLNAVCGRPFLVANQARLAPVETRADWLDATLCPDVSDLTPLERAKLAAHWAHLGQMEHASIAAFARFNLQLLSLGAPSDLLEACNRALADETAHARACFALASAYGAAAVGPARLDIEHCFEDTSLVGVAKLVLREGCVGETVASLEAVAAAEVAQDPAVKRTLARIARDELRHAELAFQFLRWALSVASVEERHELACEAAQQLADFESEARHREPMRTDDRLAAHGLVGGDALRAIHLAAVHDVSRPLLAALFDLESSNEV